MPLIRQTLAQTLPDGRRGIIEIKGGTPFRQTFCPQGITATEIKNDLLAISRNKALKIPCQTLEMSIEITLIYVNRVRLVPKVDP